MEIYFQGVILAVCTFFIIGLLHPAVVKWEYYFGTKGLWQKYSGRHCLA